VSRFHGDVQIGPIPSRSDRHALAAVLSFLLAASILPGCSPGGKSPPKEAAKAVPVTVGSAMRKDVPIQIRAIGGVEAYSTVSIKTMVGGQIVKVGFAEGQDVRKGDLLFEIDPATGTIQLKGTFANADRRLWPGQFANVVLTLTTRAGAVVVPSPAIQTGQQGQYLFVVKPDLTVEARPVATGQAFGEETIVEKGVQPGEQVVTDGHLRLVPGARVEAKQGAGG
jgi:multidrug efflux pump subunit AcrA (membrane-fusion protein)